MPREQSALSRLRQRANETEALNRELGLSAVDTREVDRFMFLTVRPGPPYDYAWTGSPHTPEAVPTYYLEIAANPANGDRRTTGVVQLDREQVRQLNNQLTLFLKWYDEQTPVDTTPEGAVN